MMNPHAIVVVAALLVGGCLDDELELSETEDAIVGANRLTANRLTANRLTANKVAANRLTANSLEAQALMATAEGRDVMSFIVGCAMPSGQNLTLKDPNGVSYTYPGWLNLAPAWATRVPTVSERRWVTACLLARTNVNGVPVNISMRHDTNLALTTTSAERTKFTVAEGAFYGDLFAATPVLYACSNRSWTQLVGQFRACALSANGVTTDCGFTYTGSCSNTATCTDKTAPFGACKGGATSYAEVLTIFLTPTQQQGQTQ